MAEPAVKMPLYLLYLDAHHLGDDIFLNDLASHFHRAPTGEPSCLIVHGSGEKVERTLESQGLFPERKNGVLDVDTPEQVRLVERAVREKNQDIVATLTDEVVPTVGIQGVDRSLLQLDEDGQVVVSKVGWVEALVKQRVIPVVSALVRHPEEERVREVYAADAAVALADAFGALNPTVVFFTTTGQPNIADAGAQHDTVALDTLSESDCVADEAAVRRVAQAGTEVLLTNLDGLFHEEGPRGTRVVT